MKKIVLFAMGLVLSSTTLAQDVVETTIRGDLVSSYIWRGQDLGSTAIQPTLGVGYKGLSLTAWGSYGLVNADDVKEFDLTLDYTMETPTVATSSMRPTVPTMCLKATSATISALQHSVGSPISQAMMVLTRTASEPTAVM